MSARFAAPFGDLDILHPPPAFAPTPASRIAVQAIADHASLLAGDGIDWGCGVGLLAIAAARIPAVTQVIGLDIDAANVAIARQNAARNGVAAKTAFWTADSYRPLPPEGRAALAALVGRCRFILANPPASEGDDGFGFRRRVLAEGAPFLAPGGVVFLNISAQYGQERIARLLIEAPGFAHGGVLSSSDWTPFDLQRPDLLRNLHDYAAEERRGGLRLRYSFGDPQALAGPSPDAMLDARTALARYHATGESPLSQWQVHLFHYRRA